MSVIGLSSLKDTLLWKQLNTGFRDTDGDIAKQLSISLLSVCEEAYQRMKAFPTLHPQYTLHDEVHLLRVTELMGKVLGEDGINVLNPIEIALLILAAHFHDQGMVLENTEISVLDKDPKYILFRQSWKAEHPTFGEVQNALKKKSIDVQTQESLRRAEEELLAALHTDYIRTTHGSRSATFILAKYGNDPRWKVSEVNLASYVAQLAQSHVKPALDLNSSNGFRYDESIGNYTVNMVFLGVILRLADILDFDRDRTPDSIYRSIHFTSSVSLQEWEKHRSVSGWVIDKAMIRFTAYCEHPVYERAIRQFMDWIDSELSACHTLINSFPKAVEHYHLDLPLAVNRERIGPKDRAYIYHDLEFSLSRDQIVKLLMTDQLYGSPHLCIRELLQNALDAIRLRRALILRDSDAKWTAGQVKFEHFLDKNGYEIVRCTDNGSGMDEDIITRFLTNVGRSYYRSPEFEQERHSLQQADADFEPIGQFGIGFMSCFMLGDNIRVHTKKDYGYGRGHGPSLIVEINGLGGIVTIRESTDNFPIGTTVEINCGLFQGVFNDFAPKVQVVNTISDISIATEFPVSAECNIPENISKIIIPTNVHSFHSYYEKIGIKKIKTDEFIFTEFNSYLQGSIKESFLINDNGEIVIGNDEAEVLPAERVPANLTKKRRVSPELIIHKESLTIMRMHGMDNIQRISFDGIYVCGTAGYEPRDNNYRNYSLTGIIGHRIPIKSLSASFTLNVRGNLKAPLTPARTPLETHAPASRPEWVKLENYILLGQARIYENLIAQRLGAVTPETYWKIIAYNDFNIKFLRMSAAWQYLSIPCTDKDGNTIWIPLSEIGSLTTYSESQRRDNMIYTSSGLRCEWKEGELWNQSSWYSSRVNYIIMAFCVASFENNNRYILTPTQPEDPKAVIASRIITVGDYDNGVLMPFASQLHEALTLKGMDANYNINHPVIKYAIKSYGERGSDSTVIENFFNNLLQMVRSEKKYLLDFEQYDSNKSSFLRKLGALYSIIDWSNYSSDLHPPYKIHHKDDDWISLDADFFSKINN